MPTTPLGFWTPDDSDDWDLTVDLATTAISIDTAVAANRNALRGPFANIPAFGIEGRTYYATDTNQSWFDTGSAWVSNDTGLYLLGRATGSTVASLSLNNVFTNRFKRYSVSGHIRMSAVNNFNIRFRNGGVDDSGNNYGSSRIYLATASTTAGSYAASTAFTISGGTGTEHDFSIDLQGMVDAAEQAQGSGTSSTRGGTVGNVVTTWSGHYGANTNFDGISLIAGAGTLTGELVVYGYA